MNRNQDRDDRAENDRASLSLQSQEVEEGCVECGLCQNNCLFLQKYGLPKEIAAQNRSPRPRPVISFECSLCGLCTAVCPKKIDPAAMFFTMRLVAKSGGEKTSPRHRSLLSYERWGGSPVFSWYGLPQGCDTVFFPGCAMAGSRPGQVLQVYQHLRKTIPSLGMVLDCCTKPSHDLARKDYFFRMFGAVRQALAKQGIQRVLVACPSCYRVWKDYGGSIEVRTIYEQLNQSGVIRETTLPMAVSVHDSCPTRYDTAIHKAVRSLVTTMGFTLAEMKHHGRTTICCGEGGAACYLVPRFAGNWTKTRALEAGEHPIVTYCAGCTHFLGSQSQAVHLTDLFFEPEKTLAGRIRGTRSPMTWLQRLLLKLRLPRLVRPAVSGRRGKGGAVILRKH